MSNASIIRAKAVVNIMTNIAAKSSAILLLALACSNGADAGAGEFYQGKDRYRGFYWFEDQRTRSQNVDPLLFAYPTPDQAQAAIEERKKELNDARAQMIELGFREDTPPQILRQAIIKYKKLEAQMHESAIRLVHASEMVNFTNPEIANITEFPTNVFANKIQRAEGEQKKLSMVKEFAKQFDLLLFSSSDCRYCQAFAPIITNFAKEHGFTLDVTTLDGKAGKIAQGLGITGIPTLVAVDKNGQQLFEISRGFSSLPELVASVVLANKLSNEQSPKLNERRK